MPAVCLYFQIHQPFRLRRYSIFDASPAYFDEGANAGIVRKVADRCYLPAARMLLELIGQHAGKFRLALSVTGTAVEQFEAHAPEVLLALQELAKTGCVEFLGETYYHSLAVLYSRQEFAEQVEQHQRMIQRNFGQTPRVFRNTELIYNNDVARCVRDLGFDAVLAEGWEAVLASRSAAFVYRAPGTDLKLLLRNHALSDAIAFRFSEPAAPEFPVTEEKFADAVTQIGGHLCNLFMDMETFGEHQSRESGIFEFFSALPERLMARGCEFLTPGACIERFESAGELDVPHMLSWADAARDLSAWLGNAMQTNAEQELYRLEPAVRAAALKHPGLLGDWRKLTSSDHAYYMATKHYADGGVHAYFSPYESPYDGYINFMNVMDNVRSRVKD